MGIPKLYELITPDGRVFPYITPIAVERYFPFNPLYFYDQQRQDTFSTGLERLIDKIEKGDVIVYKKRKKIPNLLRKNIKNSHKYEEDVGELTDRDIERMIQTITELVEKDLGEKFPHPREDNIEIEGLISINSIEKAHDAIMNGEKRNNEGKRIKKYYSSDTKRVGEYIPPSKNVYEGLQILIGFFNAFGEYFSSNITKTSRIIAELYRWFAFSIHLVLLHPFSDGNGRLSRIMPLVVLHHIYKIPAPLFSDPKREGRKYHRIVSDITRPPNGNIIREFYEKYSLLIPSIEIRLNQNRKIEKITYKPERICQEKEENAAKIYQERGELGKADFIVTKEELTDFYLLGEGTKGPYIREYVKYLFDRFEKVIKSHIN